MSVGRLARKGLKRNRGERRNPIMTPRRRSLLKSVVFFFYGFYEFDGKMI